MAENTIEERIKPDHDYSFKAPDVGMSDNEFIGYAWFHVKTPRGMFTKHQIARLIFLAGSPSESLSPKEYIKENSDWVCCGTQFVENESVEKLIKLAEEIRDKQLIPL